MELAGGTADSDQLESNVEALLKQIANQYGPKDEKEILNSTENSTDNEKAENFGNVSESASVSDEKTPKYQRYYKASGLPKELTEMFGALHCTLCNVHVSSPMTAKAHYQGKSHLKKIKAHLITWCKKTGNPMPELPKIQRSESIQKMDKCSLCDVIFNSPADAEVHFTGKNHMKRLRDPDRPLKKKKIAHIPEDPTNRFGIGLGFVTEQPTVDEVPKIENTMKPKFVCDLCNVQAIDENQLKQHLNGIKHFKALKAKASTVVPAPVNPADSILATVCRDVSTKVATDYSMHRTPTGHYYCQTCNLTMNSEEQFTQHVESKKHKAKMSSKKPKDNSDIDVNL